MTYLLLYDRETVRFFDMENDFEQQFVAGAGACFYELTKAKESLGRIIAKLAEEFNFEAVRAESGELVYKEIRIVLLKHEDDGINKVVAGALKDYVVGSYELSDILDVIFTEITETKADALGLKYGMNYNGVNYKREISKLHKGEFNLLGYTVNADMLAKALPKLGGYNNG